MMEVECPFPLLEIGRQYTRSTERAFPTVVRGRVFGRK
jgi:hypothetical protein